VQFLPVPDALLEQLLDANEADLVLSAIKLQH
jgi:hypothetical protein